jgi:hypothetical protein
MPLGKAIIAAGLTFAGLFTMVVLLYLAGVRID